jgi:hypothetical protein
MTYFESVEAVIRQHAQGQTGEQRIDCPNCQSGQSQGETLGYNADTGVYACFRPECDVRGNFKRKNSEKKLKAAFIWDKSRIVSEHGYPTRKQIQPTNIRVDMFGNWLNDYRDQSGEIRQIQMVNPEKVPGKSDKYFLSKEKNDGVGFTGAAYRIEGSDKSACICEGPATGWSIHHATGATVYCVGGCKNFKHVVPWVKPKYKKVVVCADAGNGEADARKVAQEYNVLFAVPGIPGTDFNDMAIDAGLDAVKTVLDNAKVPGKADGVKVPDGINAADLLKKIFPDPKWAVEGILMEGLNIMGGKPKAGKSILALNLCLQIALGGKALQVIPVERGTTIYLALEDVQRRLKERIGRMLEFDPAPENLFLFTEWPRLGEGGARALHKILADNPDTRLLVIDTLAKIRPPQKSNGNLYSDDYAVIDAFKKIADKHRVAVLIIHHLRKMEGEDVFDTFSGTLGLTGAADGLMVMRRNGTGQMIFSLRGRDIEEQEYVLEFDPWMFGWKIAGKAVDVQSTDEKQKIFDCLKESGRAMTPKQITETTGLDHQYVRKNLPKLCEDGTLKKEGYGKYTYIDKGNSSNSGNSCNTGNSGNSCESVADTCPSVAGGDSDRQQFKTSNDGAFSGSVASVASVPGICGNSCRYADLENMTCIFELITGGDDTATPIERAAENCPAGKGVKS